MAAILAQNAGFKSALSLGRRGGKCLLWRADVGITTLQDVADGRAAHRFRVPFAAAGGCGHRLDDPEKTVREMIAPAPRDSPGRSSSGQAMRPFTR